MGLAGRLADDGLQLLQEADEVRELKRGQRGGQVLDGPMCGGDRRGGFEQEVNDLRPCRGGRPGR